MTDADATERLAAAVAPFRELVEQFISGVMSADEFQTRFMDSYLGLNSDYEDDVFAVLDGFFADVDAYVEDPSLRERGDLGSTELRERAEALLRRAGLDAPGTP